MAFEAQMIAERPLVGRRETPDDYDVVRQVIEYVTENWREPAVA